jgi:hypothetical protein
MKRFFRLLNIRLHGKYELLKSIHRKIITNLLYESVLKFINIDYQVNPEKFDESANEAQINYFDEINKK